MNYEDFLFKTLETRAERMIKEEQQDPQDTITVDVPLFIRLLELAREDIKSDPELHNVVERTLAIKNRGTLTMDDYPDIAGTVSDPTIEPADDSGLANLRKLAGIK